MSTNDKPPMAANPNQQNEAEVDGHVLRDVTTLDSSVTADDEAEVKGHRASTPNQDRSELPGDRAGESSRPHLEDAAWDAEVVGHADMPVASDDESPDAGVAGHMHPYLGQKLASSRQAEDQAYVQRERQAREAQAGSTSGSVLDKIRRKSQS